MSHAIKIWRAGTPVEVARLAPDEPIVLTISMHDDRTVQLVVDPDGDIELRGWGNDPLRMGNMESLYLDTYLPASEPTHDDLGDALPPRQDDKKGGGGE